MLCLILALALLAQVPAVTANTVGAVTITLSDFVLPTAPFCNDFQWLSNSLNVTVTDNSVVDIYAHAVSLISGSMLYEQYLTTVAGPDAISDSNYGLFGFSSDLPDSQRMVVIYYDPVSGAQDAYLIDCQTGEFIHPYGMAGETCVTTVNFVSADVAPVTGSLEIRTHFGALFRPEGRTAGTIPTVRGERTIGAVTVDCGTYVRAWLYDSAGNLVGLVPSQYYQGDGVFEYGVDDYGAAPGGADYYGAYADIFEATDTLEEAPSFAGGGE
ncbi:MAG: hypothetical protein M5R40_21145 [Anaerolineae bacterium]|nr:hypothetical protein [Anaerolineae bacterium]